MIPHDHFYHERIETGLLKTWCGGLTLWRVRHGPLDDLHSNHSPQRVLALWKHALVLEMCEPPPPAAEGETDAVVL